MSETKHARRLRLMADYNSYPVWDLDRPGDVDPAMLPLSEDLRSRLRAWAEAYDRTLNHDYPPDSAFPSAEAEQQFESEGLSLYRDMVRELGPGYKVSYFSNAANTEIRPLDTSAN